MEFTGEVKSVFQDFETGQFNVTLAIDNVGHMDVINFLITLFKQKISVKISKYRKKRSLNANKYYWTLLTKLATVLQTSNAEQHNSILRLCDYREIINGQFVYVEIPETDEARKMVDQYQDYHLASTSDVFIKDGMCYRRYIMLRGSHTYNTAEMSRMISLLISECKEAEIPDSEIATPDEKRILKERYGVDLG